MIRSKVLTALRWSASLRLVSQVLSWAMSIAVVRALSPADYGLMSLAMLFIGFLTLVNELGLGAALVQRRELDTATIRQAFGLVLLTNGCLFVLMLASAPLVAAFFDEPQLTPIVRVLSLQFLIISFAVVPEAGFVRDINFRTKSIVELVANFGGGALTLILALTGLGVWSLVWGAMLLTLIRALGFNLAAGRFYAPQFRFAGARQLLGFGGMVAFDRVLWFFYSRMDVFIVGKVLGTEVLGVYSVAMHVASLPMQKLNSIVNEIAFPAFAQIQQERERVVGYLYKGFRMIALFAFPTFLGIGATAPEFVPLVLGEKWQATIVPMAMLAAIMPLRMLSNLLTSTLQGIGRADTSVGNLLIACIIMPIAFAIGARWGIVGVAAAWLAAFPLAFAIELLRSRRVLGLRVAAVVSAMARPALLGVGMWALVMGTGVVLPQALPPAARLSILVLVGAGAYGAGTWLLNRRGYAELVELRRV